MTKTVNTRFAKTFSQTDIDSRSNPKAVPVTSVVRPTDVWTVTHGDNLPDWKARIRNGQNASTSLSGSKVIRKASHGTASMKQVSAGTDTRFGHLHHQHLVGTPVACSSTTISKATTDAAISFTKHFRSNTEQWRSGEFLGTLVQTARLVHEPALLLRKSVSNLYTDLIRSIKAGGVGIPAALVKRRQREAIAESYLVWKFGIEPTVKDLNDACTAARALSEGRNFDIIRLRGQGHAAAHVSASGNVSVNTSPWFYNGMASSRTEYEHAEVIYRGAWKAGTATGELPVPQHFGLLTNEIIPTAWELVPWSFFYDYFSNIGDVLDAWNVAMVDFAWLNRTTRSSRTQRYSDPYLASPKPSYTEYLTVGGGHADVVKQTVLREPLASLLDARFRLDLRLPSLTRLLNINALAQMKIKPRGLR